MVASRSAPVAAKQAESAPKPSQTAASRKLVRATCGAKITFAEGKYCWNNEARFGGLQYCREHQAALR